MNSSDLLKEASKEFASLKAVLEEDGDGWPSGGWQQSQFLALLESANRKKKLAMSMLEKERAPNWFESPDPAPQVTAHCPFCGRWYRDARTSCTDGCGGTLTEVKRISLKARRMTYSTTEVLDAAAGRPLTFADIAVLREGWSSRYLRTGLDPNATRASVEGALTWPVNGETRRLTDE